MTRENDVCQKSVTIGTWKDPNKLPVPETGKDHPRHCRWCQSIGLDGKHGNHWANNGIVYDNNLKVQGDGDDTTNNKHNQPATGSIDSNRPQC